VKKADAPRGIASPNPGVRKARAWSLLICALAAGLAFTVPGPAATAAVTRPASQQAYTTFPGRLYSVAAVSADDVWAAGLSSPGGSLIVHWDGSAWSQSLIGPGYLEGVAASSARDAWAVGGTSWFSPNQTLAEHWNGKTWTKARTPSPAGGGAFNAVAVTSVDNAWAVGQAGPGPGIPSATTPLIERWNGRTWTIQRYQAPASGGHFAAVAATSPHNAWAVGSTGPASEGTGQQTLIEHWNGTAWTRVPSPDQPGSAANFLTGVTVVSASNAWAVGYAAVSGRYKALTMHWNGRHWTLMPASSPGGDAQLLGVTLSWTNNIWAVGYVNPTRCGNGGPQCQSLAEHWNSVNMSWRDIPTPNPPAGYLNMLWSVSAVSRTDIWAVGTTDYASTLIIHWNGKYWS
jgi:hypothetical protein